MTTYAEQKKAWAREWALMRKEYLQGRVLDALVIDAPGMIGVRWECPICGDLGSTVTSEKLAQTAGRGHMQTHISREDSEALEDLKVTRMPEQLLTRYQRERRNQLLASDD